MRIEVTQEHWDRAVNVAFPIMKRRMESRGPIEGDGYCETCVLAQAFLDAGFKHVMVNQNVVHLDGVRYELPMMARAILNVFDRHETAHRLKSQEVAVPPVPHFPIEFELGARL